MRDHEKRTTSLGSQVVNHARRRVKLLRKCKDSSDPDSRIEIRDDSRQRDDDQLQGFAARAPL